MKSHREELRFNTPARVAFVNIMGEVQKAARESRIKEGPCFFKKGGNSPNQAPP